VELVALFCSPSRAQSVTPLLPTSCRRLRTSPPRRASSEFCQLPSPIPSDLLTSSLQGLILKNPRPLGVYEKPQTWKRKVKTEEGVILAALG
jgi:hypothetical protein